MASHNLLVMSDTLLASLKDGIFRERSRALLTWKRAEGMLSFLQAIHFHKPRAPKWITLFLLATASLAQPRLQPSLELVQFYDRERGSYLEINYAIPRAQLKPARQDANDSLTFALAIDLRLYREQTLWATKTWKLTETVAAKEPNATEKDWLDALRYLLEMPGSYRAVLRCVDLNSPASMDSAEAALTTRAIAATNVELSDVILASDIRKATSKSASALIKNGYEVVNNPRLIFGETQPALFYYYEAYHLNAELRGEFYKSYFHVENENGEKVEGLSGTYRAKKKPQTSSVEMGAIEVANLSTGVYTLVYGVADSAKNMLARGKKKFYVYHGAPATTATPVAGNGAFLAHASPAELDDEFNRMQHFILPEDKKLFLGLNNAEAKRAFIASLWDSRKPEEYVSGASFRQVYLGRAKYAELNFPSALRPGWKGDRGRIYILYGPPSHVERETSNANTKPYEIWRYDDLQGGVLFVFADRTGFKNYELVHSTHRNELQNPDWERTISLGTGSDWKR